jgi:hypothetical protein
MRVYADADLALGAIGMALPIASGDVLKMVLSCQQRLALKGC